MQHFGIIGYPLDHSFSPTIHNTAFEFYNINAEYSKIEIEPDKFEEKIISLKDENWSGFNVTIPHKQHIIPYLDELEPICERIGAVNTVKVENNGKWKGYNTDYTGFIKPIEMETGSLHNCLLIGAGGAAQAVGFGLLEYTPIHKIVVTNRTEINGLHLIEKLKLFKEIEYIFIDPGDIGNMNEKFDLIVNTTSVGMGKLKDKSPVSLNAIWRKETIVYDLIYNPGRTRFLMVAENSCL
ncbi:MAG: shikimate dehydrogenase, partial [Calditrichaceae bacterium]